MLDVQVLTMWRWPLPVLLREIEHDPLGLQVLALNASHILTGLPAPRQPGCAL